MMKTGRRTLCKFACLILLTVMAVAYLPLTIARAELSFPERPLGYVSDFASMLSPSNVQELEARLSSYEQETTNEIAVVTVEDLQGTTIEDYAVRLFEKWKIGKAEKDNGVLLLIAKSDRKLRIEVGYGLEPTLTDGEAYGIISGTISPAFKQGDFDGGVKAGVDQIVKGLSGAELPQGRPSSRSVDWEGFSTALIVLVLMLVGTIQWLGAVLARSRSWWAGGAIGGIGGLVIGLFASSIAVAILALLLLVPLGLFYDFVISTYYRKSKDADRKTPWWAGGSWSPFDAGSGDSSGGFGGGFGGFGGGDSGGGGASGDW